MRKVSLSFLFRYGVAVLAVALAILLQLFLDPVLGKETPLLFFFAAVMASAWYGGLGAGLFSAVLCALAAQFLFSSPSLEFSLVGNSSGQVVRLALFVLEAALICWLTASFHFSRQQAVHLTQGKEEALQRERSARAAAGAAGQHDRDLVNGRMQAEQAIRASEARFRQLAEAMPQIVWTTNAEGRTEYINQQGCQYTGLPAEQANDPERLADVTHPEDRAPLNERWQESLTSGKPYEFEFRLKRAADGAYRWFLSRAVPIRDEQGRIVHWFGTSTDIDDQKRTEEWLKAADRRKDEFLAMLSHELRNPLAPIRNALHLLRMAELDDAALAEARDVVERQVQRMAGIINDLLDIFRITHHKVTLHKEPLDLAGLVRETVEDHRSPLEESRLTVTLEVPEAPVWVVGDRTRLSQVLTNLLHNAAKFTNSGDQVFVRLLANADQQRAAVRIRDTGIGIPAEILPHVFDTFTQADQSLDRRRGGLGLGLALVKGIVELHGGEVRATSAGPGRGAEFSFWLPLGKEPRPSLESVATLIPSATHLRILIVEDNRDTARTLGLLLKRYGHEVATAHSGTTGVHAAKHWRPDVVLCDLGLPEMDGYEVASVLRQDPAMSTARLIAVSGYGQDEDRRRSEAAGFDLHLTKPVDPAELQRLLAVLKVGS